MFKELADIADDFETSLKLRATFRKNRGDAGNPVEITVVRKRRRFTVNGEAIMMLEGRDELIFAGRNGEYVVSDAFHNPPKPVDQIAKDLHRGWHLPEHRICAQNVDVPTVRVVELGEGDQKKPWVCVQWFGVADGPLMDEVCIPQGSQFFFSLNGGIGPGTSTDQPFKGDAESFRVVFIGQAKDWLKPEAAQAMIDGPGKGNPNAWLAWLLSPKVLTKHSSSGLGPASPLCSPDLLGDPNCGVIVPKLFGDLEIRDVIIEQFLDAIQ